MLKLGRFLKPHWKMALAAPLLMLLEVVMDLYQPTLLASIVDVGIAQGDVNYILRTGLLMLAIALIGVIGGVGCTITSSYASQYFGTDLRDELFRTVQSFSFANLDQFKTSSLITRLTNDVTQVQQLVLMSLRMMVRAPLLAVGGIFMAVRINPRLSMILLVSIPVLALMVALLVKKGFRFFSLVQKRLDKVNNVMRENLSGIRLIKAFVRSDHERSRFAGANEDLRDVSTTAGRLMALAMPMIMLVMNFSIVAIIWFGGLQVQAGTMLVGEIMAFVNYMMHILFSLMMVAFMFVAISRAKASGERIQEVLETEVDLTDLPGARDVVIEKGRVEFQNVTFSYPGARGEPVLRDVSFTVEPGQTAALLGGTGAGKSTLVSLMLRLYDPTAGRILIDGHDVKSLTLDSLRRSVSIVLQEAVLFSGTIADNIRWGRPSADEDAVQDAAMMAQADAFIRSFPDQYQSVVGQRAVNLSGGQKQRVSIARGLIKNSPILVLDDSTSAVDLGTESRIQAALKERDSHSTTFVIAQRITSVMDADVIMVLEDGRIVDQGTHAELLAHSEIYRDIYRSQMGEEAI